MKNDSANNLNFLLWNLNSLLWKTNDSAQRAKHKVHIQFCAEQLFITHGCGAYKLHDCFKSIIKKSPSRSSRQRRSARRG